MKHKSYSLMEIREMGIEEMEEALYIVEENLAKMKGSLDYCRVEKRDRESYQRLAYAHRMKGIEHQTMLRELKRKKQQQKKEERMTIEKSFVAIARLELDKDLFMDIMEEAEASVNV